ncbi:hypothetical protein [Halapricum hydrolyticum]|uniref:Uncharacterized protein n=1 Tax=Halapricum hydrolyticum TaxID=2979991 RepID=A0AAE3I8Z5_9EURY|nr:hypothetical protein [Halapricum hydrolyticum]MCU4717094.1 hypothetical protein [Halapricum hydrolyticum]MCU4726021.1 hypothetical protein [Halapricum hydrolyticum]
MRRRTFVATGTVAGLTFLAGCGSNDSDVQTTETGTTRETSDGTDTAGEGEFSVTVEPSTAALEWGVDYSLDVTMEAGNEPIQTSSEIWWETNIDPGWTRVQGTNVVWDIPTGQSETKTFDIIPPATGDITFAVADVDQFSDILTEWELAVAPPQASLGEAISYYDGLDVSMQASLQDTLDVTIHEYGGAGNPYEGEYSIRPTPAGSSQWLILTVAAENSTANVDVAPPNHDHIDVLAAGIQLERKNVLFNYLSDRDFEIVGDPPEEGESAYMVDFTQEQGYYDWQNVLVPTATATGWLPYVANSDVTLDDIAVLLEHNEIRARWE